MPTPREQRLVYGCSLLISPRLRAAHKEKATETDFDRIGADCKYRERNLMKISINLCGIFFGVGDLAGVTIVDETTRPRSPTFKLPITQEFRDAKVQIWGYQINIRSIFAQSLEASKKRPFFFESLFHDQRPRKYYYVVKGGLEAAVHTLHLTLTKLKICPGFAAPHWHEELDIKGEQENEFLVPDSGDDQPSPSTEEIVVVRKGRTVHIIKAEPSGAILPISQRPPVQPLDSKEGHRLGINADGSVMIGRPASTCTGSGARSATSSSKHSRVKQEQSSLAPARISVPLFVDDDDDDAAPVAAMSSATSTTAVNSLVRETVHSTPLMSPSVTSASSLSASTAAATQENRPPMGLSSVSTGRNHAPNCNVVAVGTGASFNKNATAGTSRNNGFRAPVTHYRVSAVNFVSSGDDSDSSEDRRFYYNRDRKTIHRHVHKDTVHVVDSAVEMRAVIRAGGKLVSREKKRAVVEDSEGDVKME
ncbi:hypothetical protein C8R45DRAFT_927900 [Mycena sanguinolenta]|nr:hypothetical protein C8R45DRAFT_927900 [Mycena sanguinolenta]